MLHYRLLLVGLALAGCARFGPPGPQPSQVDPDAEPGDDDDDVPSVGDTVRIATWNVGGVGVSGSEELDATIAVLARIDADVVALNEVDEFEESPVEEIADALGYGHVVVPSSNPFGDLRNAVLSRLPVVDDRVWRSSELSGDPSANDLTRLPIAVTVDLGGETLTVVAQHWKSGFDDIDEFRRAVDAIRTAQAAERADGDLLLVVGDVNHEVEDGVGSPSAFTSIPSGAPGEFWLGDDLYGQLGAGGVANDPFGPFFDLGLEALDALQGDGRVGTRDDSGRRIDYLLADAAAADAVQGTFVYDARDDDLITLPLAGDPPAREATALASDHFPVVADLVVSGGSTR